MLDVGWSELLVIAVVLIVVVGPKDLPPMLRAFAKMSRKFSGMASEFRKQFDDALNEADMGDLRQTISDVQKLHPVNSLREAMNPLRQAAEDIRSDIKRTVEAPATPVPAPVLPEAPVSLDPAGSPAAAAASTTVPGEAKAVTTTEALAAALPVPPVAEVVTPKPKAKRATKAAADTVPVAEPAKPVRRKKADAQPLTVEEAKPRKKAAAKKKDEA